MSGAASSSETSVECRAAVLQPVGAIREAFREECEELDLYMDFVNYLSAAQIYLKDNCLLERELRPDDIKPRLLGHWGTCPGINLVYAHCNRIIRKYNQEMILVTGPGHGAPANLSNLFAEGSLGLFYSDCRLSPDGAKELIRLFSWPTGFPSHVNAETPGSIHEGGELGYALSVAFGAVMDKPDLIVPCLVGDGEAETGPTATAWHSTKFIDPAQDGAVLPILHLNGYKISEPTIFGTMSDEELTALFTGYGYRVRIVDGFEGVEHKTIDNMDLQADLLASMEWAYAEIKRIQRAAREGAHIDKPQFPMLILRNPKGWTGPAVVDGLVVEGSFRSHQVPAKDCKTNSVNLKVLEKWLRKYKPEKLFECDERGKWKLVPFLEKVCPSGSMRMGCHPLTCNWREEGPEKSCCVKLDLPSIFDFERDVDPEVRDRARWAPHLGSSTQQMGEFLREVMARNPQAFRIFSPDELESNRLDATFKVTHRCYQWPVAEHDSHIKRHSGGRVLEMLSEHTCQGWMQGYALTGRWSLFPTYEAFLGIVATMMDQYAKFLKMAGSAPWRGPYPSLCYLETSTLWRQEHNGFSHQNPGFINTVLNKKADFARVYLPPDGNTMISTIHHCLGSLNKCNLIVSPKHELPQWFTMEEARAHCRAGAGVMKFCSTDGGVDPDVVLVGIGGEVTSEVVAASKILAHDCPGLRIRVVNVTDLFILGLQEHHPHGLRSAAFDALFTKDKPVIINFHGYPSAVKQLLFGRPRSERFHIHGYEEEGTTTTPLDMCVVNKTDRFHLAIEAIDLACTQNSQVAPMAASTISHLEYLLRDHGRYIAEYGEDSMKLIMYPDEYHSARDESTH